MVLVRRGEARPDALSRRVPSGLPGLTIVPNIFRVSAASKTGADVDAWLATVNNQLRDIARVWIARMRACGDDVGILIHDGCPVACVGDAPFAYVNAFAAHVNIGFFYGASLEDPGRLLIGAGKRMRHVKIGPQNDIDVETIHGLLRAAHADIGVRLTAEASLQRLPGKPAVEP